MKLFDSREKENGGHELFRGKLDATDKYDSENRQQSFSNEQEMLAKISNGDEKAFKELFKMFWPQVYGTSFQLTKSAEQAKDLSQEVFIKVWQNRSRLVNIDKVNAYLYTVTKNYAIDFLRKKVLNNSNVDFFAGAIPSNLHSALEKLEYKETEYTISKAIDNLPCKVREVFQLSRVEGLTHVQIADRLNISTVSSKTYIVRALQSIRQYMNKEVDMIIILVLITIEFSF